jgi:hypothetical protein
MLNIASQSLKVAIPRISSVLTRKPSLLSHLKFSTTSIPENIRNVAIIAHVDHGKWFYLISIMYFSVFN